MTVYDWRMVAGVCASPGSECYGCSRPAALCWHHEGPVKRDYRYGLCQHCTARWRRMGKTVPLRLHSIDGGAR